MSPDRVLRAFALREEDVRSALLATRVTLVAANGTGAALSFGLFVSQLTQLTSADVTKAAVRATILHLSQIGVTAASHYLIGAFIAWALVAYFAHFAFTVRRAAGLLFCLIALSASASIFVVVTVFVLRLPFTFLPRYIDALAAAMRAGA